MVTIIGKFLIWQFNHQLPTHQIKVLAKFSDYTVEGSQAEITLENRINSPSLDDLSILSQSVNGGEDVIQGPSSSGFQFIPVS